MKIQLLCLTVLTGAIAFGAQAPQEPKKLDLSKQKIITQQNPPIQSDPIRQQQISPQDARMLDDIAWQHQRWNALLGMGTSYKSNK